MTSDPLRREQVAPPKSRPQRRSDAMYGIGDQGTKWLVLIRRAGVSHARIFAFSTHGGKAAALVHARAWRDAILDQHPIAERREVAQKLKSNNTSGVPGVICGKGKNGKPRRWIAHTQIAPGKVIRKSFGIAKYGYDGAKALAIAERARQLECMEGYVVPHPAALAALYRSAEPYPPKHLPPKKVYAETPGVRLTHRKGRPQSWTTRTMVQGKRVVASFSVATYGNEKARQLALEERARQLKAAQRSGGSGKDFAALC